MRNSELIKKNGPTELITLEIQKSWKMAPNADYFTSPVTFVPILFVTIWLLRVLIATNTMEWQIQVKL